MFTTSLFPGMPQRIANDSPRSLGTSLVGCTTVRLRGFFLNLGGNGKARGGVFAAPRSYFWGRGSAFITAAAAVAFLAAAVSLFGCHPLAANRADGTNGTYGRAAIDFVTPNPDVPDNCKLTTAN